jgi:hypothetical protein
VAARAWTSHLLGNLEVVHARRAQLPFRFPTEVAVAFRELLTEWNERAVAAGEGPLEWSADMDADRVRWLLRYWANLDSLTPDLVERLGVDWSPPIARPFFAALVEAVADGFAAEGLSDPFVDLLAERTPTPPSTKPS